MLKNLPSEVIQSEKTITHIRKTIANYSHVCFHQQTQPLMILEPSGGYLYTVRWSPVRPLVMAVTTQDGHLLLYDLKKSQSTPVQTLEASPNKQAVYSAEFNLKQ